MPRELNEEELKAVTQARLEYEDEIDVKLYALRDVELFQAGFRAGLEYAQLQIEKLKDDKMELAYLLSRGR